jgi:hypothetical protein
MRTQQEQLNQARRAYLLPLNTTWTRWAVYLDYADGEELQVLWPGDSHLGKQTKELLPGQIWSKAEHCPAFHFHLTGCGYSKQNEIASTLAHINPDLQVFSGLQSGCQLHREK